MIIYMHIYNPVEGNHRDGPMGHKNFAYTYDN